MIAAFLQNSQKTLLFTNLIRKMASTCASSSANANANRQSSGDYVEEVVCQDSDLKENELNTFDFGGGKVLVVKQNGIISALGNTCTHYGSPLVNGALGEGRVRCPWHGACFSLATGDIEDFPGLDSLPCYKVTVEGNNVKVCASKADLQSNKRVKAMADRNMCEPQRFVVIGGGPAGAICVETLRQEGFTGQLTLVCKENCLPYDRVKVSKAMDVQIEQIQFRADQFYQEYNIDVLKGTEAVAVDTCAKTVSLCNETKLKYDRLFIATGCKPRKINMPGDDLNNVVVLRNYENAKYINSQLAEDKEVVVLGSSFIAMEAASYCASKAKKVTIIMVDEVPFSQTLGSNIGTALMNLFKENQIEFIPKSGMTRIIGDSHCNVTSVELTDGTTLKADLVIMGVGSTYNTNFLETSNIAIRENGTIETDEYLQTNVPGVYVGGDIAYAPVWSRHDMKFAIGHFGLAHYHGRIAALNMLGKMKKMETVPYFWTMMFGKSVRYAGNGQFDDIIYTGNVDEYKFVAFYLKDDEVVAASSCGMDPVVSQFAEFLAQGKKLSRNDIKDDPLAWTKK